VCAVALAPLTPTALALALAPAAVGDTASSSSPAPQAPVASSTTGGGTTGAGQTPESPLTGAHPASATLEQCATATAPQTERAATFAGEMIAVPGTTRMQIRIDIEERSFTEGNYRIVRAPELASWHSSNAGVKTFTHIQQVTNLSAPAFYRALVSFRWLDAQGHAIKTELLHTAGCEQPAGASSPSSDADAPAGAPGAPAA
jgi:hypothetical protein